MFEKIKAWIKRKRETAREQQAADRLIKHIEQALGFELYEWQRLYIITGIWQPPEGRLHGRTTAYILRLLLDQSKPLLLYEFSQVAAHADNPFMGRQYQPVVLLRYREREAWRKTPYQITTLFKYHKEYNPHIFRQEQAGTPAATENMDDIDIALGGF